MGESPRDEVDVGLVAEAVPATASEVGYLTGRLVRVEDAEQRGRRAGQRMTAA